MRVKKAFLKNHQVADCWIKYAWSAAGYMLISIPVMLTKTRNVGVQTKDDEQLDIAEGVAKVHNAVAKRTESKPWHNTWTERKTSSFIS